MTVRPIARLFLCRQPRSPSAGQAARGPSPAAGHTAGSGDVVCGIGRIDASGRVADRAITSALGWRGGDPLTVTASAGVMVAPRPGRHDHTMPAWRYIVIPAAVGVAAGGSQLE